MTNDAMTKEFPMNESQAPAMMRAFSVVGHWSLVIGHYLKRGWSPFFIAMLLLCGCTPPGPRALLKGQRLIQEGKYEQAVESLQMAARALSTNAQAYNHLGLALHGSRQYGRALAAYQKALELDHKLAAARYNMGCLLLEQNDPNADS